METVSSITLRKRKKPLDHECTCSNEMKEIRTELSRMSSILEKYAESNQQLMDKMQDSITEVKTQIAELKLTNEQTIGLIRENITEVKTQVNDIKSSSLNLSMEHNNIKTQVTLLESKLSVNENKINSIESNLDLKNLTSTTVLEPQLHLNEQLIREVQERNERERNIIIAGLPEQTSASANERTIKDETDIMNITYAICKDIPKPTKVYESANTFRKKIEE